MEMELLFGEDMGMKLLLGDVIAPEPSYDETKIAIIELDGSDEPTETMTYVDTLADAKSYLDSNDSKRYSVVIGDQTGINAIDAYAFSQCANLVTVVLPDGTRSIGKSAFYYCTELKSVSMPDTVLNLLDTAFESCTSLCGLRLSEAIDVIAPGTFWGCTGLQEIVIPASCTFIGTNAFYNCTSLTTITVNKAEGSIRTNAGTWGAQDTGAPNARIIWTG